MKSKSGYFGVLFLPRLGKFQASIRFNDKVKSLGCFYDPKEAATSYDEFIIKNNLNKRLNFPLNIPINTIPNTKLIALSKGKFTIVDDDNFEKLNSHNWSVQSNRGKQYATRMETINGVKTCIYMHQVIMNLGKSKVDHKNGDGLHNYRSNLRECTYLQNNRNARPRINCTSKYKGVCWSKINKKFVSRINTDSKRMYLGSFNSEIEAAKAYDEAAIKYHGEFAYLNFPNNKHVTV